MYLKELNIINFKNIESAQLVFSQKLNCLVGKNGMGKTNILDAIYMLSFCKSAFINQESLLIRHNETWSMVQGVYSGLQDDETTVSCGLKKGTKKHFRLGQKEYKRLLDHIGLIPLVLISPQDGELIAEGSDYRRRFMDSVISQYDKQYLQQLLSYNTLVKQRNALLKQAEEQEIAVELFEVLEEQLAPLAVYIFNKRQEFINQFLPVFDEIYKQIAPEKEDVSMSYRSQLFDRDISEAFKRTRQRDLILGWTSQGIHKDDLDLRLGEYPLKQVGSQGQQKTYLLALKLAQAVFLNRYTQPILLLDDIFDKLDSSRVERILQLVESDMFGQIVITDTDRQHISLLLQNHPNSKLFEVEDGEIK